MKSHFLFRKIKIIAFIPLFYAKIVRSKGCVGVATKSAFIEFFAPPTRKRPLLFFLKLACLLAIEKKEKMTHLLKENFEKSRNEVILQTK